MLACGSFEGKHEILHMISLLWPREGFMNINETMLEYYREFEMGMCRSAGVMWPVIWTGTRHMRIQNNGEITSLGF